MKSNITLCLVLVLNCLNTICQKSSETSKLRIPLMEGNFQIIELDGKTIDNPFNNPQRVFIINEGFHKALIKFNLYPYFQAEGLMHVGIKSSTKVLEFTAENNMEYILKGLMVNTYDSLEREITINDNRYVEVVEKKSEKKVGGIVESGIVFFNLKNDTLNCPHLYYGEILPNNQLTSFYNLKPDYSAMALTGKTNDGYKINYFSGGNSKTISKDIIKFKPGIYNIYYQWNHWNGSVWSYSMVKHYFKATPNQLISQTVIGSAAPGELRKVTVRSSTEPFVVLNSSELNDIFFLDDGLHGWIVGEGKILRTTDGGRKWSYKDIGNNNQSIYFIDSLNGWVGGNNGLLLHTSNGGINWTFQKSGSKLDVKDIYFKNANEGLISQQNSRGFPISGCIMHTKDSGNSWVNIDQSKAHLPYHYLININNIWKYEFNALHFSDNLGATWQVRMGSNKAFNMTLIQDFTFLDENNIWVIKNGLLYYTNDKGINWEQKSSQYLHIDKLLFVDLNNGYAIESDGNVIKTIDSGKTWNKFGMNTSEYIMDIEFKQKTGWAISNMGGIFRTDDGGKNWKYQNLLDFIE